MQILIDECLDWRLKREFPGHSARTVTDMGWGGIKNGALLALAQARFEVFITGDRNLSRQQQPANFSLAIIVLRATSTRLADCLPLIPKVIAALPGLQAGTVTEIHP
ncbi:MAG TPA: DUF5615 family PIN-like protein [Pirellulaceae bacterium]|nr:DUF5615 family PIN-like protein [Pirellulaceae bacterium]